MNKIKLLTGEYICSTARNVQGLLSITKEWKDISAGSQAIYNETAKHLNQDLGLCEECGERPVDGVLHEIADDYICTACNTLPANDPHVQYMHFVENADGTLAGAITPPAGMSLEDYKAQLTEAMKDVTFRLLSDVRSVETTTITELYALISKHVHCPVGDERVPYFIYVFKGNKQIGRGHYLRTHTEIKVISQTGAACGLNDTLCAYAMKHVSGKEQSL